MGKWIYMNFLFAIKSELFFKKRKVGSRTFKLSFPEKTSKAFAGKV